MPFLGSGLLGGGLGVSGGSRLIGATWAVDGNGRAYNTPTLGSELLTDGGLENWTSANNLTSWSESVTGASTVNQESSDVHSGTYAARLDVDASGSNVIISQTIGNSIGDWLVYDLWVKASAVGKFWELFIGGGIFYEAPGTAWKRTTITHRESTANVAPQFHRLAGLSASSSLYFDDISIKRIAVSTLLAYVQGTATNTPLARLNAIAANTQAGVIGWCDDPSNPHFFVIAIRNGSGSVNLTKCVGGTYTNLISSSVTFVTDAAIEIRRPSGNTFQLWYNGSQVGADQTINDSAIADNTAPFFGPFSTYSGNTFTSFSLNGVDIPFPGA